MKKELVYIVLGLFLAGLIVASCKKWDEGEDFVHATIYSEVEDNLTVKFSATVIRPSTAQWLDVNSYFWDFGDGNTSTEKAPIHSYEMPKEYLVTLTAKGKGFETTQRKSVTPSL